MNTLASPPANLHKKLRILIVEDDLVTALAMTELLEDLGCMTHMVNEGTQACRQACEFHPEIVLLDIDLPGMNGYDVAQMLRHTPDLSGVLIIAITGHNEAEDKQKAYRMGMDLHLGKPVRINFLKELVSVYSQE